MTIHKNSVAYFKSMAAKAIPQYVKDYWNRRAKGAEDLERQLAARAKAKRKLAQREDNLAKFKDLDAPKVRLESKHPNGCIVHWEPPTKWEPDTYMVLVKDTPMGKWRSVASSNITRDSRWVVLTKSYLAWGEYKEPYYIAVAAVRDGVGRKESETFIYPPSEPKLQFGENPFEAEVIDRPISETRAQTIIHCLRTYTGRRTRTGRPYMSDFRKHCKLNPRVGYREMRNLWKQLDTAPTGEEKWK